MDANYNIKILVVEDDPEYLGRVVRWLNRFGYHDIVTTRSAEETIRLLDTDHFHVIIADMRIETDNSGFVILEAVNRRNIATFVIIFTANDTVEDCRKAFKSGVWDYIGKNMRGNPFDRLHHSMQEAIIYGHERQNTTPISQASKPSSTQLMRF
ncbi:response regulator [Anaerolineales bacterium HSG24]|nr:response regulator [Anaerolineales bacterium HSG24]